MTSCDCDPCDYYEERAAIRQHDGRQSKTAAESAALTETLRKFGREALEHMQGAGTVVRQEQGELL